MYKINMIYCIYIYDPNFRIELNYFGWNIYKRIKAHY